MFKAETDHHSFRKNVTIDKTYIPRNEFEISQP